MRAPAIAAAFAAALLAGCTNSSRNAEEASGEGAIRAVHAMPTVGAVTFLIEETALAGIDYRDVSGTSTYDNLTYEFNFDILLPGDSEASRLASLEVTVDDEIEHTFILTGTLDAPEIVLWEQFRRDWTETLDDAADDDTTVSYLDIAFGHLASSLGAVDVYLAEPGTAPAAGAERATLSFGELQPYVDLEAGDYQIVVTPSGDASTYLYASDPFTLSAANSVTIVVSDNDEYAVSPFAVQALGDGTGTELPDINAQSLLRVVHAAFNTAALDVIVGDQFDDPLAANLAFGERSEPGIVDDGSLNLNITPAGNPGSFIAEETIAISRGTRNTLYLTGLPGQLDGILLRDQTRRLSTHAIVGLYQGSERVPLVDFYLVAADSDIALVSPTVPSVAYTGSLSALEVEPGGYDVIFTLPGTKTVVAGPVRVDLRALGIYEVVTADSLQTDVVQTLFLRNETDDTQSALSIAFP